MLYLLYCTFRVSPCSVPFLPQELACSQEWLRMFEFPSLHNNVYNDQWHSDHDDTEDETRMMMNN